MSDWRLRGQMGFLFGVTLKKSVFRRRKGFVEHDHCEFCWQEFSEREKDLHEGYTTEDEDYWICNRCYRDFKEQFRWQVK